MVRMVRMVRMVHMVRMGSMTCKVRMTRWRGILNLKKSFMHLE